MSIAVSRAFALWYVSRMRIIGIDENGLGPLLGPLTVTAAVFEADSYDPERFWRAAAGIVRASDSKRIFSARTLPAAEAATLEWLAAFGVEAASHQDLVSCLQARSPFIAPCGGDPHACCQRSSALLPRFGASAGVDLSSARALREAFTAAGIALLHVRVHTMCPGALNAACAVGGMSKLWVDCRLMLDHVIRESRSAPGEVFALLGKIGAMRRYGPWLFDADLVRSTAALETPPLSAYDVDGVGRISFVRDGDALHLPIAVASMVGKYVRELAVEEMNERLGAPHGKRASGYRDPLTAAFVRDTAAKRAALGLPDRCFLREV